jgi:hypothetical protein
MPRYTDTQLKKFPFEATSQAHTMTMESELVRTPKTSRHMFDFDLTPDEPWATMESLEDIDSMLFQELGSTLDDIESDTLLETKSLRH